MKNYVHITESTDETIIFEVLSSSRNTTHIVSFDKDNGWLCTCEQYYYRKQPCKHMQLAREHYKKFYNIINSNQVFKRNI